MNDKRGFQTRFCTVAFAAPERKDCITIAVQRAMLPWQANSLLQPVWCVPVSQGAGRCRAGLHEEDGLEKRGCGAASRGRGKCQNLSRSSSFPLSTCVWFCRRAAGGVKCGTDFQDGNSIRSTAAAAASQGWPRSAVEAGRVPRYHPYVLPWIYGHHKLVWLGSVIRKLKRLVMPFQNTWRNPKHAKKNEARHPPTFPLSQEGGKKPWSFQFNSSTCGKPSKVNLEHSRQIINSAVIICIFKHKIISFTLHTSKDSGLSYFGRKNLPGAHKRFTNKNKIWFFWSFSETHQWYKSRCWVQLLLTTSW